MVAQDLRDELAGDIEHAAQKIEAARLEIAKVIIGQKRLIDRILIALLTGGHILLEGVPGVAKTLTVNTLAKVLKLDFKRIQFTPDLLPSDLIGTTIYNSKEGTFTIEKGPVFTNLVLADEINRAPPKVQSALLEVMQEKQVTISGETLRTKSPFMVLATENPIEHEGTYPLPEAQTDRFMMKVLIGYPSKEDEIEIVQRLFLSARSPEVKDVLSADDIFGLSALVHKVYIDPKVLQYIVDLVFATRFPKEMKVAIDGLLEYGASPRASIALTLASKAHALLQKRAYVTPFDVKEVGLEVMRHRLILSYEAEAKDITADDVIKKIFEQVPMP